MNIVTDSTTLVVMVSENASPTPPAGGQLFALTNGQRAAYLAIAATPNGGIRYDGANFTALPVVPPVPFDFDSADKALKALGLMLRDYTNGLLAGTYTNKSIAQEKADFLAKYNSLP